MQTQRAFILAALLIAAVPLPDRLFAQGMPADMRQNIHALFNGHDTIQRSVRVTTNGYTASTESTDPTVAAALREHAPQMSRRLESGLMVRRWDPAFVEYIAHYAQIEHRFEALTNGLKVVVIGRTPTAIKVAQNHASVISDFVAHGWEGHDRTHPALADQATATAPAAPATNGGCARGQGPGARCRGAGAGCRTSSSR